MDRGTFGATVHSVTKSQTQLKQLNTQSSVDGCLVCFYTLANVNNAAVNIEMQMSLQYKYLKLFCMCTEV